MIDCVSLRNITAAVYTQPVLANQNRLYIGGGIAPFRALPPGFVQSLVSPRLFWIGAYPFVRSLDKFFSIALVLFPFLLVYLFLVSLSPRSLILSNALSVRQLPFACLLFVSFVLFLGGICSFRRGFFFARFALNVAFTRFATPLSVDGIAFVTNPEIVNGFSLVATDTYLRSAVGVFVSAWGVLSLQPVTPCFNVDATLAAAEPVNCPPNLLGNTKNSQGSKSLAGKVFNFTVCGVRIEISHFATSIAVWLGERRVFQYLPFSVLFFGLYPTSLRKQTFYAHGLTAAHGRPLAIEVRYDG